ncbi:DUF3772 domain-containing protein [uncultured Paracoccus sp.]|uniref:DUF3772 domain-containing protein n=1 Tax=uncultured Paracoccus sp. TaxID=189685 RepID=UPI0026248A22|nr:DUF3772 domain-containing protein [uncultured Paracoccus sp.]
MHLRLIRTAVLACLMLCLVFAAAPQSWRGDALWLVGGAAHAQDATTQGQAAPDYAAWDRQASQIEAVVAEGEASNEELNALRQQAVAFREEFLAAQNVNAGRINTVRDQIAALGPAPAEGETEAEDVAARRRELNATLSEVQAPGLQAVEAASRASGIIQSIDKLQRDRQATALLRLSPSPLLPSSWRAAATDGVALVRGVSNEVSGRFTESTADDWRDRIPGVLGYLIVATVLLTYGWRWIGALPARLSARMPDHSRGAAVFVASLGQIVVPAAGVYLVALAIDRTGLVGDWGRPFLLALPSAGLALFAGRWLARMFFPARLPVPMPVPDRQRQNARLYANLLAALVALQMILNRAVLPLSGLHPPGPEGTIVPMEFSEAGAAVWHLPLIGTGALLLFRLALILRNMVRYDDSDQPNYSTKLTTLVGQVARPLSVIVVLLALVGYVSLANGILWPAIRTLALLGTVILLQDFIADLYGLVLRDRGKVRQALAPVLIGFALVLASLPVFALIWGARPSDLLEWWARLRQGVSLGGVRLSPSAVVTFLVIFAVGYTVTRVVQGAFRNSILPKTRIDAGGQNAIVSGLGYVGVMLATVLAITSAGIDLSNLAIVAGALSVGIGFGLQNIVSNFVSGIILLIERPIAIGDWIRVGNAEGFVKRISVRSTQIQTFDRTDVIVPNSDLISQPVINWTRGSLQGRIIVPVSVAYGTDSRRVTDILMEIAEDQPIVLIDPPPAIMFTGFGADGLDFEIRAILSDINQGLGVATEIRHQIAERFAQEGIEIPYAHRVITISNVDELAKLTSHSGPRRAERTVNSGADRSSVPEAQDDALDPRIARSSASGMEGTGQSDGDGDGDGGIS